MKILFNLLLIIPLLLTSCSREEIDSQQEFVEVSFRAEFPDGFKTKADGEEVTGLSVNKVVCTVFEDGVEIIKKRDTIEIINDEQIIYSPILIKSRTYDIVFWAMKDDNYNVADLTSICRNTPEGENNNIVNEEDYDAFTGTLNITVGNYALASIVLSRPLAQLNLAITEEDWDVASNHFHQTPETTIIEYAGSDCFNALTGNVKEIESESVEKIARVSNSDINKTIIVDEKVYRHLGSYYILTNISEQPNLYDISYSVYSKKDSENQLIKADQILNVPIMRNYRTNLVGSMLTGEVTFQISIDNSFNELDIIHNNN